MIDSTFLQLYLHMIEHMFRNFPFKKIIWVKSKTAILPLSCEISVRHCKYIVIIDKE